MLSNRVVVGRQGIQNRDGRTIGYELLFRADPTAVSAHSELSGDQMTAEVLVGALGVGLDGLLNGRWAFCNADRGVLVGDVPLLLPPDRTIVEVLETIAIDDEVIAGCRALVEQGYRLALDDFVAFDGDTALLELASIVKVDVRQTSGEELEALIEHCRPHNVKLLAEKIESAEELEYFRELGFELFQGYHLERPVVVAGRALEPSRASRLRMATMLMDVDLEFDDLLELLRSDPGVAVHVMRLASLGRPGETRRKIATIRDALVLAGTQTIQKWMALVLLRPERSDEPDRFVEVLTRARAVETLCAAVDPGAAGIAFSAGLLSALDLMLGVSADELRETLGIDDELAAAAFGPLGEDVGDGALAGIVRAAREYQLGYPVDETVDKQALDDAFAAAFAWTAQTVSTLDDDTRAAA